MHYLELILPLSYPVGFYMHLTSQEIQSQFRSLTRLPSDFNSEVEADHVSSLLETVLVDSLKDYDDGKILGIGGSGIVLSAKFKPAGTYRAIKLPRQRIFAGKESDDLIPDPELAALDRMRHTNITQLFGSNSLGIGKGACIITELVEAPLSLHKYCESLFANSLTRMSDAEMVIALKKMGRVIYELASAINYMHTEAETYHFDIKPDNLLVSIKGHPYVTDLGFAREPSKHEMSEMIEIGFTWDYAHPDLTNPRQGARVTQTPAKSKNKISAADISPRFDIFAFGRSIQQSLHLLEKDFGEHIVSLYEYKYMHLVACLCLDGHNSIGVSSERSDTFASDQAMGLPINVLRHHKFISFQQVMVALEKLLGKYRIEDNVPELNTWSNHTINVSDIGITPFTERVNSIVTHPIFSRLSNENQLGMLDTVFPTATHSRFQHSIGVFHATVQYIRALYYDPGNPTFRILCDPQSISTLLVAALVHDIGQTAFGHEMEEVDESLFSHVDLVELLLKEELVGGKKYTSMAELIGLPEPVGWNIQIDGVIRVLRGKSPRPMETLLHDIIDSKIDADKLDYLIRDSVECRVPYGRGIDVERFVRSLTTVGHNETLHLAINRKGAAAAEALAFARYQLFQSVYWHHTFRSIKAMFRTAAMSAVSHIKEVATDLLGSEEVRRNYIAFVYGARSDRRELPSKRSKVEILLKKESDFPCIGKYADDLTIQFVLKLCGSKERQLVRDVVERRYYKRIYEISPGPLSAEEWIHLRERFIPEKRGALQQQINSELMKRVRKAIQNRMEASQTAREDELLKRFEDIQAEKICFLIDIPLRGAVSGGGSPGLVRDFTRRHFAPSTEDTEEGYVWSTLTEGLMRNASLLRVFCEPSLHNIITRVLRVKEIEEVIFTILPELSAKR